MEQRKVCRVTQTFFYFRCRHLFGSMPDFKRIEYLTFPDVFERKPNQMPQKSNWIPAFVGTIAKTIVSGQALIKKDDTIFREKNGRTNARPQDAL